jgi:hypothetical protein
MKVRTGILRGRRAVLLASTISISIAAFPRSGALAADLVPIPSVQPLPAWYFYGGFEAGARFYIDKPSSGFGRAGPPLNWQT